MKVARYINEQRALFLKTKPFGFSNEAKMYVDSSRPLFFDKGSSHMVFLYIAATINSALITVLFLKIMINVNNMVLWACMIFLVAWGIQLAGCLRYFSEHDGKKSA